jgi:hypothetical protein
MYYEIFIKGKKNWGYRNDVGGGGENFFYLIIQRFWALTGK